MSLGVEISRKGLPHALMADKARPVLLVICVVGRATPTCLLRRLQECPSWIDLNTVRIAGTPSKRDAASHSFAEGTSRKVDSILTRCSPNPAQTHHPSSESLPDSSIGHSIGRGFIPWARSAKRSTCRRAQAPSQPRESGDGFFVGCRKRTSRSKVFISVWLFSGSLCAKALSCCRRIPSRWFSHLA